jgi:hypothetical protein
MSTTLSPEELLEQWKESMQRGIDAWLSILGRTPQPDIAQYWMPFFAEGMAPLAQIMRHGASPEMLHQWKQCLDQGVEAWSKALEKAMASETFASAFGKYLNQYLDTVGPVHKEMKKAGEAYLRVLGLPSRTQVAEMTSQMSWVESRIEELEAKIEQVLAGLAAVQAALEKGATEGRGSSS